jgi:sugar phosphate isomerase/epimerase
MKLKNVGAQLYTLRDLLKTPADIAATLRKVRAIGYETVQISGLGPIEPKELKKILDDCGLWGCTTHEPPADILNKTDRLIERLKILGAVTTAIPWIGEEYRSAEGYKRLALQANEAGRKLKAAGITLMYHNHGFEFQRYGDKLGLEILYDESDSELLQGEIDTYWVQFGGGNPAAWCRRLKGRMPLVHLKDMTVIAGQPTMAEIGQGNIDFKAVRDACDDGGVTWFMVEQDACRRPPLESMKISYDYIKETLCT